MTLFGPILPRVRHFALVCLGGGTWLALACFSLLYGSDPNAKPSVDPVALNGPIFENWPVPKAALLISAELNGYIEPCGCTGLDNQKGGFKRRDTLLKSLRSQGWPIAAIDAGGMTKRIGAQSEIKYRFALDSLIGMGYGAIGLGSNELQLSADSLAFALGNIDPTNNPLTAANVGIFGLDSGLVANYKVLTAGTMKFGVMSVLGTEQAKGVQRDDVPTIPPRDALDKFAPKLANEACDVQILMVHGKPAEARLLAAKFPQFDMVVATGGAEEPANRPSKIEGSRAMLIEPGQMGKYVIVIGLYDDRKAPLRYQRVPIDSRFADSPAMQKLLVDYQNELESVGLAGLGITGAVNPDGKFVGSEACADCHTKATEAFEKTPHAHATERLINLQPPRHFDPECLSCHVTGWNPQEYFPYVSGFLGVKETPLLMDNGCENCHGPGADHVAAEAGDVAVTDEEREVLRQEMRRKIVANEGNRDGQVMGNVVKKCVECHDVENSPEFDFQKYWQEVEHVGKD